jgi:hypothetical protein
VLNLKQVVSLDKKIADNLRTSQLPIWGGWEMLVGAGRRKTRCVKLMEIRDQS